MRRVLPQHRQKWTDGVTRRGFCLCLMLVCGPMLVGGGCVRGLGDPRGGAPLAQDQAVESSQDHSADATGDLGDATNETGADSASDAAPLPFGQGRWLFGSVAPLTSINSPGLDACPWLDTDLRTLYFASRRDQGLGNKDVFVATRSDANSPFGAPQRLNALSSTLTDAFFPARDGTTAFLVTGKDGSQGQSDIWIGTRSSSATPWSVEAFVPLAVVNNAFDQWDPYPSHDGSRLYFSEVTGDDQKIWVSPRDASTGAFGGPQLVAGIDGPGGENDPAFGPQMRVMVFVAAGLRPGAVGKNDLWYTVRLADETFSTPQILPSINTEDSESEPFISPDGSELFFSSDRPGSLGDEDIYRVPILEAP